MPKKVMYESAVHQLASAGKRLVPAIRASGDISRATEVQKFIHSWIFDHLGKKDVAILWTYPRSGKFEFNFEDVSFYTRGDSESALIRQKEEGLLFHPDQIQQENQKFFDELLNKLVNMAFENNNSSHANG